MTTEYKLSLITECEKLALPLVLFAMYLNATGKKSEKTAITKETNIEFTFDELIKLYECKSNKNKIICKK